MAQQDVNIFPEANDIKIRSNAVQQGNKYTLYGRMSSFDQNALIYYQKDSFLRRTVQNTSTLVMDEHTLQIRRNNDAEPTAEFPKHIKKLNLIQIPYLYVESSMAADDHYALTMKTVRAVKADVYMGSAYGHVAVMPNDKYAESFQDHRSTRLIFQRITDEDMKHFFTDGTGQDFADRSFVVCCELSYNVLSLVRNANPDETPNVKLVLAASSKKGPLLAAIFTTRPINANEDLLLPGPTQPKAQKAVQCEKSDKRKPKEIDDQRPGSSKATVVEKKAIELIKVKSKSEKKTILVPPPITPPPSHPVCPTPVQQENCNDHVDHDESDKDQCTTNDKNCQDPSSSSFNTNIEAMRGPQIEAYRPSINRSPRKSLGLGQGTRKKISDEEISNMKRIAIITYTTGFLSIKDAEKHMKDKKKPNGDPVVLKNQISHALETIRIENNRRHQDPVRVYKSPSEFKGKQEPFKEEETSHTSPLTERNRNEIHYLRRLLTQRFGVPEDGIEMQINESSESLKNLLATNQLKCNDVKDDQWWHLYLVVNAWVGHHHLVHFSKDDAFYDLFSEILHPSIGNADGRAQNIFVTILWDSSLGNEIQDPFARDIDLTQIYPCCQSVTTADYGILETICTFHSELKKVISIDPNDIDLPHVLRCTCAQLIDGKSRLMDFQSEPSRPCVQFCHNSLGSAICGKKYKCLAQEFFHYGEESRSNRLLYKHTMTRVFKDLGANVFSDPVFLDTEKIFTDKINNMIEKINSEGIHVLVLAFSTHGSHFHTRFGRENPTPACDSTIRDYHGIVEEIAPFVTTLKHIIFITNHCNGGHHATPAIVAGDIAAQCYPELIIRPVEAKNATLSLTSKGHSLPLFLHEDGFPFVSSWAYVANQMFSDGHAGANINVCCGNVALQDFASRVQTILDNSEQLWIEIWKLRVPNRPSVVQHLEDPRGTKSDPSQNQKQKGQGKAKNTKKNLVVLKNSRCEFTTSLPF